MCAAELTAPEVTGSAARYMPEETADFGSAVWELFRNVLGTLRPDLKEASGICMSLMATVLLVSLELSEVMNLSDRILVMYEGEIMAELPRAEATEATVAVYMTGAKRQGGAENG
mgnify:CR=1 FL=1